jgi:hypothetical protein
MDRYRIPNLARASEALELFVEAEAPLSPVPSTLAPATRDAGTPAPPRRTRRSSPS